MPLQKASCGTTSEIVLETKKMFKTEAATKNQKRRQIRISKPSKNVQGSTVPPTFLTFKLFKSLYLSIQVSS